MTEVTYELYINAEAKVSCTAIARVLAEFVGEEFVDDETKQLLAEPANNEPKIETASFATSMFGMLDHEFRLLKPLNESQVIELQRRLRDTCGSEVIDVGYEEWPTDDQLAEDGPTVSYSGDEAFEPVAEKIQINYRVTRFTYDLDRNMLSAEVRQILDDNSVDLEQRAMITFAYEDDAVTRSIRYESSEDTDAVFEVQLLSAFTAEFRKRHDDNGFHSADLEPFDFFVAELEVPQPSAEDKAFTAEIFARLQALKAA